MLEQIYTATGAWFWLVLGLILVGVEIFVSGTVILWFGIAAILVGFLDFFTDFSWQVKLLLFLIMSIGSLVVYFKFFAKKLDSASEDPLLNQRVERLIGREFVLSEDIVNGSGRINIDDTVWRISGPDLKKGDKIRIVDSAGSNLRVEPIVEESA